VTFGVRFAGLGTGTILAATGSLVNAYAAPTCSLTTNPNWGFAPENVHVVVTAAADTVKGGPIKIWLAVADGPGQPTPVW
jgi:hypothetical protein